MGYREILEDKILKFPATPRFKGWKNFFTDESTKHPAKLNLNLLRHIIITYTEVDDVLLDPMAGTGSTIILASLLGRHGIAVEFEPQFCKMIDENISRTRVQSSLISKGSMICIQGDARELSKLLEESDAIITSPPYSSQWGSAEKNKPKASYEREQRHKKRHSEHRRPPLSGFYSTDMENIGNLPHGDIDTVITSPPYGEAQSGGGIAVKGYDGPKHSPTDMIGERSYMPDKFEDERNISRLKYGKVDAVVSSPPYGNRLADDVIQDGDEARMSYRQAIDSIVTSPPYEGSETETGSDKGKKGGDSKLRAKKDYKEASEDNIGSMRGETYLEAMLKVYRECHKVLKLEGKMILITKNFIRDKAVVRLDLDTIKLCESAGFTLRDRCYFKLPTKSFWRRIYERNFPDAPKILYEDVLIFGKITKNNGSI